MREIAVIVENDANYLHPLSQNLLLKQHTLPSIHNNNLFKPNLPPGYRRRDNSQIIVTRIHLYYSYVKHKSV